MQEAKKDNVTYITLTDKQCRIIEKRDEEKKQILSTREQLVSMLTKMDIDLAKVEGKLEALTEIIAEENDINVEAIGGTSYDTDKKLIVFTLRPIEEKPQGLTLVGAHENEEDRNNSNGQQKEEEVESGSD